LSKITANERRWQLPLTYRMDFYLAHAWKGNYL